MVIFVKNRLKKISQIEFFEDQSMNMAQFVLDQILYENQIEKKVQNVVFREMIHKVDKYIVEMWSVGEQEVALFSGKYDGQWTSSDIEFHGVFANYEEARQNAQSQLQNQAETAGFTFSNKKLRLKKLSSSEKKYKELSKSFFILKKKIIKEKNKSPYDLYDQWLDYVLKKDKNLILYPELLWRGFGYLWGYAGYPHIQEQINSDSNSNFSYDNTTNFDSET